MYSFLVAARVRSSQGIWRGINEPDNRNKVVRIKGERKIIHQTLGAIKRWGDDIYMKIKIKTSRKVLVVLRINWKIDKLKRKPK